MSSSNTSDDDADIAHPSYVHIHASCPVCGNLRFSTTEEGIPNGFESHFVHATCAKCKTHVTIEYRAIDVFWYDADGGGHSAVSQGILDPIHTEYADDGVYARLPDMSVFDGLDWPLRCDVCEERPTGNDMVTDADTIVNHAIDHENCVLFRCPACEHLTEKTPEGISPTPPRKNSDQQ